MRVILRNTAITTWLLFLPFTASAQSIPCGEFNANMQKVNYDWSNVSSIPGMDLNLGFVMGGYFAAAGLPLEKFDESGFVDFLKELSIACSATPKKHVMPVTLDLIKKRKTGTAQADDDEIDLIDLKLDIGKMSGKSITVRGTITVMGPMAMLGDGGFDSTPIPVEIGKLSREDRKALLENCEMQCTLTLKGKVGSVMMQSGIIANSVQLD